MTESLQTFPRLYRMELATAGVWFVLALASIFLPSRGRLVFLLTLSLAAQAYLASLRGTNIVAFLVPFAVVFGFTAALARVLPQSRRGWRWPICCFAMVVVALAGSTARQGLWGEPCISVFDVDWPLFELDMLRTLLLIVFLWEFGARKIDAPCWTTYLLWSLMPVLGGTLIRYTEFDRQLPAIKERTVLGSLASGRALWLILLAAVQIAGAWLCLAMFTSMNSPDSPKPTGAKVGDFLLWLPWSFYLFMAGMNKAYQVWGLSWNLVVPVNYNFPFFRRNIGEFWQNWNMTVASIFRDLFFYNRWGLARPNVYLNLMILFLAIGAWHGLNVYWLLFGLLHGLGFCCYTWYRVFNKRHEDRFAIPGRPGLVISATITYLFVCGCWALPSVIVKLLNL